MKAIIDQIAYDLNITINRFRPVSGGDISRAYLLNTSKGDLFLKINNSPHASVMFKAEAIGLQALETSNTLKIPEVIKTGASGSNAYLLLEAIATGSPNKSSMALLGEQLALMHANTAERFGFDSDNFIGSLPQSNNWHQHWPEFYVYERLIPQIKLAREKGLLASGEILGTDDMIKRCDELSGNAVPCLLHGDLWGGNYMIDTDGQPVLIDPAVYYGHHEVDIAMSRLFGGFSVDFYEAYESRFPITSGYSERMDLYQLYYLLVHLNLFGRSYYGSVSRLLKGLF
ncbi:MAG: fructosamine kinase family protein [Bacteroidia bacterium]|nr:fructosamine kinase family protein [Bacteroidia bacterium]